MHDLIPFPPFLTPALIVALLPLLIVVALWTIVLKGFALWHAARGGQRNWFIALLVINTLGILEIVYLVWFRPATPVTPARFVITAGVDKGRVLRMVRNRS